MTDQERVQTAEVLADSAERQLKSDPRHAKDPYLNRVAYTLRIRARAMAAGAWTREDEANSHA
jgi:hypothetical protein